MQLAEIARATRASLAVIGDPAAYGDLKAALAGTGIEAAAGHAAIEEAAARPADVVVAAIVGAAGLAPTLARRPGGRPRRACQQGMPGLRRRALHGRRAQSRHRILPVDSEHNAIFQLLDGRDSDEVESIILTASGGPFRTWSSEAMARATPAEALRHPNWSMGPKVTIDSATLMNKGLELIEAHHSSRSIPTQLDVLVHPQSVVHGMLRSPRRVDPRRMSAPDMRTPIAHCLAWPDRAAGVRGAASISPRSASLSFEKPDPVRFPALQIAYAALAEGGGATNILNAANEIAVAAFLAGEIGFLDIAGMVEDTLERAPPHLRRVRRQRLRRRWRSIAKAGVSLRNWSTRRVAV